VVYIGLLTKKELCTAYNTGWSKNGYQVFCFWDNVGNSAPILKIHSMLHTEIYGT